jgi:jasmonate ZIM domain-containing protein
MLIAAAAAAATKTTANKPPMMPAAAAAVAPAAVSPMLTRSLSLQSTSVANGQPQVVADPSSICKLQAGKTNIFWENQEMGYFFQA